MLVFAASSVSDVVFAATLGDLLPLGFYASKLDERIR